MNPVTKAEELKQTSVSFLFWSKKTSPERRGNAMSCLNNRKLCFNNWEQAGCCNFGSPQRKRPPSFEPCISLTNKATVSHVYSEKTSGFKLPFLKSSTLQPTNNHLAPSHLLQGKKIEVNIMAWWSTPVLHSGQIVASWAVH